MAIRLITGVPGSGKTYFAVRHLVENYCEKLSGVWSVQSEYTIITNIDSLKLEHINLDEIVREHKIPINKFFTVPYQEKLQAKYPKIIYLLDECQKYFSRRFRDDLVFYYFQFHRHLGHDIYLITQDLKLIPLELSSLAEYELRASPRTLNILGEMKYRKRVNGEIIDQQVIRPKKEYFALYQSMSKKENEKVGNPLLKFILIPAILIPIFAYYSVTMFSNHWGLKAEAKEVSSTVLGSARPKGKGPRYTGDDRGVIEVPISHIWHGDLVYVVPFGRKELVSVYDMENVRATKTMYGNLRIYQTVKKSEYDEFKKQEKENESERIKKPIESSSYAQFD